MRTTPAKPPLSSYAVIYTRDLFNSVKAPLHTDEAGLASNAHSPLRLWGTAVGEVDRAFAIIENLGTKTQGLYHTGDTVLPGVTLIEVHWERVVIHRNGRRETLTLPVHPSPTASSSTATVAMESTISEEREGVRQATPNSFHVDRQEVDHAINNLNELFTQARAVPYSSPDGEAQGFRLFAIKPQSLIDRIGLKNGDIIQRVNGVEISDPGTAFGLLQELQGRSQVRVDVMRNHQPLTLSYEIQ